MKSLSSNPKKIKDFLLSKGINLEVKEISDSTRTSQEAANSIGCSIAQIAKSIVFKGNTTGRPILIIASGANRVDEKKIEPYVNEPLIKADADFVKSETGFAIGGVPPFSHKKEIIKFIDKDLLNYKTVWAAAGNSNSVFSITPQDLIKISKGKIAEIS